MKKTNFVPFQRVRIENGFWKNRYDLNRQVSIDSVRNRFEETGRFDAMRFCYDPNAGKRLHYFFDSDFAKWAEAVAYLEEQNPGSMTKHLALIDELVDSMAEHQREDGYLNSYHQQITPEDIFKIRGHHELYCAGHLIEAAVAYDRATGKHKFLQIMERVCDVIERAFFTEKTASFDTPGHPEIELALFKLYHYTGKQRYRDMAEGFLSRRGTANDRAPEQLAENATLYDWQDDVDIYHLQEANGHAVRDLYYTCGIADMALENDDAALCKSLDTFWKDLTETKMYITGGVGSTYRRESFTVSYDLPNHTAYAESCAAIALVFFAARMRRLARRAEYGNVIERELYNNCLSSTSLDGKAFFYENPLEIALEEYGREKAAAAPNVERLPKKERLEVFKCSCCPPNINRFFAWFGELFCYEDEDALCVEQYVASDVQSSFGKLSMRGEYCKDGKITISSDDYRAKILRLRRPEWSRNAKLVLNGKAIDAKETDGYYEIAVGDTFTLTADFGMEIYFVKADPKIRADAGRVALCRGPVVYCLEGKENGARLNRLSVDTSAGKDAKEYPDFHGLMTVETEGWKDAETGRLYFRADAGSAERVTLKWIPYYAFANRGESDMLVWVREH